MRLTLLLAGIVGAACLGGCAASSGTGSASSQGSSRQLVAPQALSDQEAARCEAALSHVAGEEVTITHLPTGVVAAESSVHLFITPDEQRMLTLSNGEVKWWSLADGSLLQAQRIDQVPFAWAKPIYAGYGGYTTGFDRGIDTSPLERSAFFSDDGQVATIKQHGRFNNFQFDVRTGTLVQNATSFDMTDGVVAVNGNRYAVFPTEDTSGLGVGLSEKVTVGHTDRYDTKTFAVNTYYEWRDRPKNAPGLAQASIAGYDPIRDVLYITRTNMQGQWEVDAFDLTERNNFHRQEVATFATCGYGKPGVYTLCKATLSTDSRYVACVLGTYTASPIVRVVDLTTAKVLGDVGPANMRDLHVISFADGLLTITTEPDPKRAEPPQVLTFHVPDLKQVESMHLNQRAASAADTSIAAVSPSHRYVVIKTEIVGMASLTVYDLSAGRVMVLNDDAPTRAYVAKANTALNAAYAELPKVLAKEQAKAKMAVEDRIKMERAVRELTLPPTYAPPPVSPFAKIRSSNSSRAQVCSHCGGSGVQVKSSTSGGYSDTYQTNHGWEKVYHAKSINIDTVQCIYCGGSGRQ